MGGFAQLVLLSAVCLTGTLGDVPTKSLNDLYNAVAAKIDQQNVRMIAPGEVDPQYNNITVKIHLVSVEEVDLEHQYLEAVVWIFENYTDPRLTWDPAMYGGADVLYLPSRHIWIPDFELYDALDKIEPFGEYRSIVKSDGAVIRVPVVEIKIKCGAKDRFNRVACSCKMGSWVYNGNVLTPRIHPDGGIEVGEDFDNPKWKVVMVSATEGVSKYECCPESYPSISYTIVLEEKSECSSK